MANLLTRDGKIYVSHRKTVTTPETLDLNFMDDRQLSKLFWSVDSLSFEDKQKLVTYLNARGYNLKLFRGEMRGNLHYTTEYFDGISWKEYKPNYEVKT